MGSTNYITREVESDKIYEHLKLDF